MQRPDRRQVRNLRHAKPLTGIVAELPVEGQHPRSCQRQYRLALFSSTSYSHAEACAQTVSLVAPLALLHPLAPRKGSVGAFWASPFFSMPTFPRR